MPLILYKWRVVMLMPGKGQIAENGTSRQTTAKTPHQNTQNENTKSPPRVWGTWGYADADSPNEIRNLITYMPKPPATVSGTNIPRQRPITFETARLR